MHQESDLKLMHPDDQIAYDQFRKEMAGKQCEIPGCMRPGCHAHHVYRRGVIRRDGSLVHRSGKILIWLCVYHDGNSFWGAHGVNEKLFIPIYNKIIIDRRPALKEVILNFDPSMVEELKEVRR